MNRNLRLLGLGIGVRSLGNAIYFPFLALFLHGVLGVGYVELGAIIAGVGVITLPFNLLGGLFTDRVGRRRLILIGLAAEAISTVGLAYAFAIQSLGAPSSAPSRAGSSPPPRARRTKRTSPTSPKAPSERWASPGSGSASTPATRSG